MDGLTDTQRRILFEQHFGVDEKCLMAKELRTLKVLRGVVLAGSLFEDMAIFRGDGIPDLGLSLVDVVDSREI